MLLNPSQRARQIAWVLWVTLGFNWTVAFLKLVLGLATNCIVIIADGLHSFSDGTSNIVGLIGVRLSAHPADYDHPYGHQKYETFASVCISFLLFLVAFRIFKEAFFAWTHPRSAEVNVLSFAVMGATFFVNLFVAWYERKKARELKSDLLLSDSWHTLSDVFVTLTVLIALVGIHFKVQWVDPAFSFVIALVIVGIAIRILKRSSDVLCDKAVLDPERIKKIAAGVPGVRDCHEVRTRGKIDDVYVDMHVLVDNEMTVHESHHLANIIEKNIRTEIPGVHDVVVHIEPVSHEHKELEGN